MLNLHCNNNDKKNEFAPLEANSFFWEWTLFRKRCLVQANMRSEIISQCKNGEKHGVYLYTLKK